MDITSDKTYEGETYEGGNVTVPEGVHITATIEGDEGHQHESGDAPFTYPEGIGQAIMNGCWGRDYQENDPCYKAKKKSLTCKVSIDVMATRNIFFKL